MRGTKRGGLCAATVLMAVLGVSAGLGQTGEPPDVLKVLSGLFPTAGPLDQGAASVAAASDDEVAASDTGLLDVHVRNMPVATLLEMLSYEARANIVASTSVAGSVSANLYDVSLEQALDAILTPNGYAYALLGGTMFVGTAAEIAALGPPAVTRVFRLRYINPTEAAAAVRGLLGDLAKVVQGGGEQESRSGGSDTMGPAGIDYVIVTAGPAELDAVAELLATIDDRPKQVLVEATVLRATLNEANEFGVDFTMLGGVDFQNVNSISNASADLSTGLLPQADLQSTTFNLNTDFNANISAGGFTFGLIKDSVAGFVRALEEITDVVVVANPKIVALNKREAEVIVGRRDGYLTTTVTETAAVQTVEFLETGTQIKFRPVINEDGTVRLRVHPKDSNGGLTAANLPFEETTEAQADILVDDGQTILIGGLFRERTVINRTQIPLLGDIPVMGELFGSRRNQTVREEVIILLTVHIIKETARERALFRGLVEDVERLRIGARRGLMGTGRERLAQAFFHEALRQLEAGEREKALFNVRLSLHNQPKHLRAFKLAERLLEQRMWDDEGARMHTFIWQLLDQPPPDYEAGTEPFGRPGINFDETAAEQTSSGGQMP
jgi:type IV pilus assembly protein PilQ